MWSNWKNDMESLNKQFSILEMQSALRILISFRGFTCFNFSQFSNKDQFFFCGNYKKIEKTIIKLHLISGEMFQQHTAAFDPLFFLYHSFIDSMWEDWRSQRQVGSLIFALCSLRQIDLWSPQNRNTRPTAYPPNNDQCSSTAHFSTSPMSPWVVLIFDLCSVANTTE